MAIKRHRSGSKKILMMTDANFLAHVSRCLEIAKVLRREYGYEVVVAGNGKFMRLPAELGFETDHVHTVAGERTLELARKAGLVSYRWWKETCEKSVSSDLECIGRQRPDAVLGDMHWSARTAADLAEIPYIAVTNAHWTNSFSAPIGAFKDHFTTRLLGKRRADKIFPLLRDLLGRYWLLPYLKLRRRHGLEVSGWRNMLSLCEGDLTLLADIPEFGPTQDAPSSFRYVGPILWEPDIDMPEWFRRLDPERPVIYFTMGSTGYTRFFSEAIQLFGDTDYQIVMTTGGLFLDVDRVPANCFIEEFLPGRLIMERSNAVVNHGGNGTVYQAMAAGTPIIGIPYHIDQEINLQRVEALGMGFMVSEKQCTPATLRKALRSLLQDPSYREKAQGLRSSLLRYDGPILAAEYSHRFLQG